MQWAGRVTCMVASTNAQMISVGKYEGTRENVWVTKTQMASRWNVYQRNLIEGYGLDLSALRESVAGCCEHGNGPSGFIKRQRNSFEL
jgi:hypothetical protein